VNSGGSKEACIRWGAHWRHLANTFELSMCGGDAAFLSNYFDHLILFDIVVVILMRVVASESQHKEWMKEE